MAIAVGKRWWRRGASHATDLDPEGDALIEKTRARHARRLEARDRAASLAMGSAFLAAAVALPVLAASERPLEPLTLAFLVGTYALAARVEFEVGTGSALPTQLVLVPMLFLLPAALVPLAVSAGLIVGRLADGVRGPVRLDRVPLLLGSSWHAFGPAVVLAVAGEPEPAWSDWPLYAGALAAQIAVDFGAAAARERLALGVSPLARVRFIAWVYLVDVALAPVALLIAFSAAEDRYAFVLALPLVGLLAIFARERRTRIDHALALGHAYRGTALLLGDVVEADDAYTGSHSRHVVDLVLEVADELGMDAGERRDAEFAALLHDIGKVRIPGEIVNKPGPLTEEERAVMETHTLEGERMLAQVGGLLGNVGRVVRSCHERYDGRGYPDGLAGNDIPLAARIVACCDALSAMTTDRSYRRALPLDDAIAELHRNAGTQFDPTVVDVVVRVVDRSRRGLTARAKGRAKATVE